MFSHPQDSRAPSWVMVTLWMSPFPSSDPALYQTAEVIECGMSLWSAGVSCPGCVPSQILLAPSAILGWGEEQKSSYLHSVSTLLSSEENIPNYQHSSQHRPKTSRGKINLMQPQLAQRCSAEMSCPASSLALQEHLVEQGGHQPKGTESPPRER